MTSRRSTSIGNQAPGRAALRVERIGVVIVPNFIMMEFFLAVEALRIANLVSGRSLFDWCILSVDGKAVKASNGMSVSADAPIAAIKDLPTAIVFAGYGQNRFVSRRICQWLRRIHAAGGRIGAVDTAVVLLAAAGIMRNEPVAVHWHARSYLQEEYPHQRITDELFVIGDRCFSCAGGIATFDMMLHMIASRHGEALSKEIAAFCNYRWLVVGGGNRPPRRGAREALPVSLCKALSDMQCHLDAPLTGTQIAAYAGVSRRYLERCFRKRLGVSPIRHYKALRFERARQLLLYTDLPVTVIALACGFSSVSSFSRAYRRKFGHAPRIHRKLLLRQFAEPFRRDAVSGPRGQSRHEAATPV